jgi:hypothetical protein
VVPIGLPGDEAALLEADHDEQTKKGVNSGDKYVLLSQVFLNPLANSAESVHTRRWQVQINPGFPAVIFGVRREILCLTQNHSCLIFNFLGLH